DRPGHERQGRRDAGAELGDGLGAQRHAESYCAGPRVAGTPAADCRTLLLRDPPAAVATPRDDGFGFPHHRAAGVSGQTRRNLLVLSVGLVAMALLGAFGWQSIVGAQTQTWTYSHLLDQAQRGEVKRLGIAGGIGHVTTFDGRQ